MIRHKSYTPPSASAGLAPRLAVFMLSAVVAAGAAFGRPVAANAAEGLDPVAVAEAMSEAYANVAEAIGPSVVGIRGENHPPVRPGIQQFRENEDDAEGPGGLSPEAEMFRRFFEFNPGQRMPRMPRQRNYVPHSVPSGIGSGVVIDAAGHILTNNHVVENVDTLTVIMPDDSTCAAEVVGKDPESDLAVIKLVDYKGALKPAELGDSDSVRIGNIVIAIGSPFSQLRSFTSGIVSGKGRELGAVSYEDYIQTDAAINPGNSGGPLVNLKGEVIGINTIISTRSGASAGVGFAVPSNQAKAIIAQLIDKGEVTRGWLGIVMRQIDPSLRRALEIGEGGAFVNEVLKDSPAAKAGVERGDVVLEMDGKPLKDMRDLLMNIALLEPGTTVELLVLRGGEKKTIEVVLEKRALDELAHLGIKVTPGGGSGDKAPSRADNSAESQRLGLTVRPLRPSDEVVLNSGPAFGGEKGLIITAITPGSPAHLAGLIPGSLLISLDRKPMTDLDAFKKADAESRDSKAVLALACQPGRSPSFTALEPAKQP